MDSNILSTAMKFMMRAELKGHEVPLFVSVMDTFQAELNKMNASPEHINADVAGREVLNGAD